MTDDKEVGQPLPGKPRLSWLGKREQICRGYLPIPKDSLASAKSR
jgi:hypothetical protein